MTRGILSYLLFYEGYLYEQGDDCTAINRIKHLPLRAEIGLGYTLIVTRLLAGVGAVLVNAIINYWVLCWIFSHLW
jgi:hypothetical protein